MQQENKKMIVKADGILYLDFGSTTTRFQYNGQRVALDTTVPYNFIFKDEYLSIDKMFENIKRDWVSCDMNKQAVIKYFEHIKKEYSIGKVKKINASYPTHFTQTMKHNYKSILNYVFNVEAKDIELVSESTALLRGSKLYNLEQDILAADIGGFTTDVFTCRPEVDVTGVQLGGELVTEEIAQALYDGKFTTALDLVKAKELKETHFAEGKIAALEVMQSIILQNATDRLVTFDELMDVVSDSFHKYYSKIAKHIKGLSKANDLIYIFGGVADIAAFQEIIISEFDGSVQFSDDTFILIDGLIAAEEDETVEVLADDLYLSCSIDRQDYYIRVGRKGAPFPATYQGEGSLVSSSKDFVTLKNAYEMERHGKTLYRGEQKDIFTSVDTSDFRTNQVVNINISINQDSVTFKLNERVIAEKLTMEEVAFQEKIEKQAQDIYEAERIRRNKILAQKFDTLQLEGIEAIDEELFNNIKQSLKGKFLNETNMITIPVPSVKEDILKSKTVEEFFSYWTNEYRYQDYKIDRFTSKSLTLIDKILKFINMYEEKSCFTKSAFEKKYIETVTKTEEFDKLKILKNELKDYYSKATNNTEKGLAVAAVDSTRHHVK